MARRRRAARLHRPAAWGSVGTRLGGRGPVSPARPRPRRWTSPSAEHASTREAQTHLQAAGVPPKTVSEVAGHSSSAFTMDRYGHYIPSMREEAAQAIQAVLGVPP